MSNLNWYTERFIRNKKKLDDHRSPYEKDKCKVVHSYCFRRLQGKIQIVSGTESDFHRNRLTHSIEVASIAKNIFNNVLHRSKKITNEELKKFLANEKENDIDTLLYTIGLLHDIGHPPFGHGGEYALNYKMRHNGGFEGNAQTLRLITKFDPLNLTFRTLLGILKYPAKYSSLVNKKFYPHVLDKRVSDQNDVSRYLINKNDWKPPKCYYDSEEEDVDTILSYIPDNEKMEFQSFHCISKEHSKTKYKSFDCSIMDIADDISYSIHDLEDALFFNRITKNDLEDLFEKYKFIKGWEHYPNLLSSADLFKRKKAISNLVHLAITDTNIASHSVNFTDPLFKNYVYFENNELESFIENLKKLVTDKLIETQHVRSIIHGGMVVIMQLFDALEVSSETLLPPDVLKKCQANQHERKRIISDYISGMTDRYLFKMHQRIFGANNQNTFDII